MTISVLFVLIHLHFFAQRVNSAPDTHVHIYVPPEQEVGQQGGQVGQGIFNEIKSIDKGIQTQRNATNQSSSALFIATIIFCLL